MRYPYLLYVYKPGGFRVTVRNFKSDASRRKAIAKLPEGSEWSIGEQLQLIPLVEVGGITTYDPRYDIPY